jgi:hypothetical protein
MPAPRRMFGFLKKGSSKHRRSTGSSIDEHHEHFVNIKDELISKHSYPEEEEAHDEINSSHAPSVSFLNVNEHQEGGTYLGSAHDDEEPTHFSTNSINHKPTVVTLAETFSSGGVEELLDYAESRDESSGGVEEMLDYAESRDESVEVEDSEYFYTEHPHDTTEYDDDGQFQHEN